jgi:hypothetical protein
MLKNATISNGALAPSTRRGDARAWLDRAAIATLIGLAGLSAVFAVLHAFQYFGHPRWYGLIQVGLMSLALVNLWAFSTVGRSPVMGGAVVFISGVALAFMWMFLPPVGLVALAVTAYGLHRAYRYRQATRAPA